MECNYRQSCNPAPDVIDEVHHPFNPVRVVGGEVLQPDLDGVTDVLPHKDLYGGRG